MEALDADTIAIHAETALKEAHPSFDMTGYEHLFIDALISQALALPDFQNHPDKEVFLKDQIIDSKGLQGSIRSSRNEIQRVCKLKNVSPDKQLAEFDETHIPWLRKLQMAEQVLSAIRLELAKQDRVPELPQMPPVSRWQKILQWLV